MNRLIHIRNQCKCGRKLCTGALNLTSMPTTEQVDVAELRGVYRNVVVFPQKGGGDFFRDHPNEIAGWNNGRAFVRRCIDACVSAPRILQ